MAQIDYPDQWDAAQIINVAMAQVWDEVLAVECPLLDSRREVIPQVHVDRVFGSTGYRMLNRVERRKLIAVIRHPKAARHIKRRPAPGVVVGRDIGQGPLRHRQTPAGEVTGRLLAAQPKRNVLGNWRLA